MVIPQRFEWEIKNHLVGNLVGVKNYPLILGIFGRPGMGKTFQLRKLLTKLGFTIYSMSSADLESEYAGRPAKDLRDTYLDAVSSIREGIPAAVVIDDIDTTVGEWEQNTGTVNHQEIIAFLMHLADDPTSIGKLGDDFPRVPVFFTGNYFDKLYEPLRRAGRMHHFEWEPNKDEKIEIVKSLFPSASSKKIGKLIENHPDEPIAFFASLLTNQVTDATQQLYAEINFSTLLADDQQRTQLKERIENMQPDPLETESTANIAKQESNDNV